MFKLIFIFISTLFLSACSTSVNDYGILYSFHSIDYGQTPSDLHTIDLSIEEEGKVFNKQELENVELTFTVVNNTGRTLEIGSGIEIERYTNRTWEVVEPAENYAEESILIYFEDGKSSEYIVPIQQRFLEEDTLTGGTYRINNNDAFVVFFVVSEFSNE